jgi:hypothetical protein
MVNAVQEEEQRQIDIQMEITAWQTALLMNATGNYKKTIRPEMLLGKKPDSATNSNNKLDREEKNRKLAELKGKFGK